MASSGQRHHAPFSNSHSQLRLTLVSLTLLFLSFPSTTECKQSNLAAHLKAQCPLSRPQSIFKPFRQPHPKYDQSSGTGTCALIIDDTTSEDDNPLSYSPWSHMPICVMADPKLSAQKRVPTRKYCVYTNSHHEARGVSVITTPETAASMIDLLDEKTNSTEALLKRRAKELAYDPSWKIAEMPHKGFGVVATRTIKRYEEIMIDHAAFLIDVRFASVVQAFKGYRLLHLAADQLRDPESIYSLAKSSEMASDEIENVVRTNSFATSLGGDDEHMAVYPLVSRINHACKPNAFTRFILRSQSTSVAALRDIQPGEEITISYLPLGLNSTQRTKSLQKWRFNCTCTLCTSSPAQIAQSDSRRKEIESTRDKAIDAFQHGRPYEAIRLTKHILKLIPSEELYPWESEQYENLARVYWLLGDKKTGDSYARLSLQRLAEQGFIDSARREYLDVLWVSFKEDVGLDEDGHVRGKSKEGE